MMKQSTQPRSIKSVACPRAHACNYKHDKKQQARKEVYNLKKNKFSYITCFSVHHGPVLQSQIAEWGIPEIKHPSSSDRRHLHQHNAIAPPHHHHQTAIITALIYPNNHFFDFDFDMTFMGDWKQLTLLNSKMSTCSLIQLCFQVSFGAAVINIYRHYHIATDDLCSNNQVHSYTC